MPLAPIAASVNSGRFLTSKTVLGLAAKVGPFGWVLWDASQWDGFAFAGFAQGSLLEHFVLAFIWREILIGGVEFLFDEKKEHARLVAGALEHIDPQVVRDRLDGRKP